MKPAQAVICSAARSIIKKMKGAKRNFLGATGPSICGLPLVHAVRQHRSKCTSVQIHLDASTRISQFSLARDPATVTRQSPRLSLDACSTRAAISFDSRPTPRLCSPAVPPITGKFYRTARAPSLVQTGERHAERLRQGIVNNLIHSPC